LYPMKNRGKGVVGGWVGNLQEPKGNFEGVGFVQLLKKLPAAKFGAHLFSAHIVSPRRTGRRQITTL
jgi:hypothetical protein